MKLLNLCKAWIIVGILAIFVASCATTQEEIIVDEPVDQTSGDTGIVGDGSGGVDATGIDDGDTDDGSAIVDDTPLNMLEQAEGALANRIIYFEFDSAKLTSESIRTLETHGSFIAGNGEVTVRLEGHTDERGSREYNIALGDRRAQSVRQVLLFQGASVDQIDTVSYGEEQPIMMGHTEDSWSQNRRVELKYTVN